MKTLLVIGGGTEAVPGIQAARHMGLHVVVSDGNPRAPGFDYAHDRLIASTYDVDATLRSAETYNRSCRHLDGVICIAADVPLTIATVANALGLFGIPITTAQLAMDKMAMKQRFIEAGVPVPWFSSVENISHLRWLVKKHGWDLVIKPVDSRGARGVLRLSPSIDLEWARKHAASESPTSRVMVEAFLPGPQISTESVLLDDRAATPGFSDRNYEYLERYAPYIIENGGHQPTALSTEDRVAVSDLAVRAARAMGMERGTAKGDIVLTSGGPIVIEMAARLSGGWFCTDQIPLATGVNLVGAAIRLALGETVDIADVTPALQRGVAIRYFFPEPGLVVAIRNAERVRAEKWVHRIHFFVKPGDRLEPATNHTRRAGFVITVGDTRKEATDLAEEVVRTVEIETKAV